jgi:hypothetical protein
MVRWTCHAAAALALVLLCGSCASDKGGDPEGSEQIIAMSEGEGAYALEQKFAMDKNAVTYGEDGTVTGGQRSQFEGKKQVAFGGQWDGKNYDNKRFEKTWWGGKRERVAKQYEGNLDGSRFQAESLMMGKSAAQDGKRSRYAGQGAPTAVYDVGSAREAGRGSVSRTTDVRTDWRRSVFPQPRITGYKQYQQREVEETRKLLGRE